MGVMLDLETLQIGTLRLKVDDKVHVITTSRYGRDPVQEQREEFAAAKKRIDDAHRDAVQKIRAEAASDAARRAYSNSILIPTDWLDPVILKDEKPRPHVVPPPGATPEPGKRYPYAYSTKTNGVENWCCGWADCSQCSKGAPQTTKVTIPKGAEWRCNYEEGRLTSVEWTTKP